MKQMRAKIRNNSLTSQRTVTGFREREAVFLTLLSIFKIPRNEIRPVVILNKNETEQAKSDKGVISRFGKLLEKIGKGFGTLSQKAMNKADQIRVSHVKESVKNELDTLKGIKQGRTIPDPFRER